MSGKFLYNYLTGELDIADDSKIDNVTWGEKLLTLKPAYKPKPKASKSEKFKYESWADGLEERTRPTDSNKPKPMNIVKYVKRMNTIYGNDTDQLDNPNKPLQHKTKDKFDAMVATADTPEEKRELRELITRKHEAGLPTEPKYKKFINHPTPKEPMQSYVSNTGVDEFLDMKERFNEMDRRSAAFEKAIKPTVDPDLHNGLATVLSINKKESK